MIPSCYQRNLCSNLKRGSTTDLAQCIVCQEKTRERVSYASEKGLVKLKESAQERQKHRDVTNRAVIDRISSALGTNPAPLVWHKSCYSTSLALLIYHECINK